MAANGLRQKDLADDLGGESIVSLIWKRKDNSTDSRWKSSATAFMFLLRYFSKVSRRIAMTAASVPQNRLLAQSGSEFDRWQACHEFAEESQNRPLGRAIF